MEHIEELAQATLACGSPTKTTGCTCATSSKCFAQEQLRTAEDPVDAVLCAYVAMFAFPPTGRRHHLR